MNNARYTAPRLDKTIKCACLGQSPIKLKDSFASLSLAVVVGGVFTTKNVVFFSRLGRHKLGLAKIASCRMGRVGAHHCFR